MKAAAPPRTSVDETVGFALLPGVETKNLRDFGFLTIR
jgi:hypothetical protein